MIITWRTSIKEILSFVYYGSIVNNRPKITHINLFVSHAGIIVISSVASCPVDTSYHIDK